MRWHKLGSYITIRYIRCLLIMFLLARKIAKAVANVTKKKIKVTAKTVVKEEVHKAITPSLIQCEVCSGRGLKDPYHLCDSCEGHGQVAK